MANQVKTILVAGATGQQGGAVAQSLLRKGQKVRALTRHPDKAGWLRQIGAEVVQGDLTDRASLTKALQGVDGVFCVTTSMETGMEGEVEQGKTMADAVRAANIKHMVYTSVGGADKNTQIPHFETKWKIEKFIKQLDLPATILRPDWFMENFKTYFPPTLEGKLIVPIDPDVKLEMIAVKDIGEFGASAFLRPEDFLGHTIHLVGDALTMPEVAASLSRTKGRKITFEQMPYETAEAKFGPALALMFQWINETKSSSDFQSLKQKYGINLSSFEEAIAEADWAK